MFLFCSVQLLWIILKLISLASPETAVAFLQEDYITYQFALVFFFHEIDVCVMPLFVNFVRYDILAPQDSSIDSHA